MLSKWKIMLLASMNYIMHWKSPNNNNNMDRWKSWKFVKIRKVPGNPDPGSGMPPASNLLQ